MGDRFDKLIAAVEFVQAQLSSKSQNARQALKKLLTADMEQAISLHATLKSELAPYQLQIL